MFKTIEELYNYIKKKIDDLGAGELLKLGKEELKNKAFEYLLDLLKQKSLEIGGPEIELSEDKKTVTLSVNKDIPDAGGLNIFGTKSGDFKLHVSRPADEFVFVLEGTLTSMTVAEMAESDLLDKAMPGFEELPADKFTKIELKASTKEKEMSISISQEGGEWDIFNLGLFKVDDIGMEFSIREGGEDEDPLVSNLAFNGSFVVGSTGIDAVVNIPLGASEDGTWTLSCSSPTKLQQAFNDLSGLLFSNSLQNCIPKELLGLNNDDPEKGIFLKQLDLDFSTADFAVQKADITVNATGKITFGGIDFTNADIVLNLAPGDAKNSMDLNASIDVTLAAAKNGEHLPAGKEMVMSLKIPSINGDWTLNSKGELQLPLDTLANIPGGAPKEDFNLPEGLTDITNQLTFKNIISVFNPSIPSWKQAGIDINYKHTWQLIPIVLKVVELNLKLDAKKTTKAGVTTTLTTGSFDGDLWAGGDGDAGFPLKINATKKGVDWTYTATAKKIQLKKIIEALLKADEITAIPELTISTLELKIDQTKKTFTGNASIESNWQPFGGGINLTGKFVAKIASDRTVPTKPKSTASIEGILGIEGFDFFKNSKLKLAYNLTDKIIKAEFEGVTVQYKSTEKVFIVNLGDLSLGTVIKKMAAWISPNTDLVLDDPWSVLNDINLKDLNLFFNLNAKTIGFIYKPGSGINLGFVSINSISLVCKKLGKEYQLAMKLDGQLAGKSIPEWDLTKPGAAPKVPGGGDSKFDLEYLAMGQRVRFKDTSDIHGMDQALTKLKDAFKEPESGSEVPINSQTDIVFNQNSNWLIGARFTIINTVELGIIFNDPQLYGLLVKLKGEKAKSFKGLEFEIIYKKVSDTVGVFEIELKLPDAMRNMEFGAISVTLPIIGLQIYTNGNFKIDIGFPWNGNFARSFTVQAFPFIGSGGLYFAWLSAETATSTPAITNGNFSPVIEFGIGMALGLGKTFEKGIMSGGLSLKVQGVLQGVIGFYNPDPVNGVAVRSDANYYAVQGALEIVGRIYGNINFAIIKASLDITVHVLAKVMFISYQPIDIYLEAGISVRLIIEIDLGLFSINVHFSFEATVKENFQVGNVEQTPWKLAAKQPAGLLRHKHGHLFRNSLRLAEPANMKWTPLTFDSRPDVNIFFMPSLTVAAKKDDSGVEQQTARYMNMLYIEAENPNKNGGPDASFTTLAKTMLVWSVNAGRSVQSGNYEQLLVDTVSLAELQSCYDYFTHVKDATIPVEAINGFLSAFNVAVNLFEDKENGETPYGSIFPMFPLLTLKSTLKGQEYSTPVDFETFTPVSIAYRQEIEAYFKKIAVDYRDPLEAAHNVKVMHENKNLMLADTDPSMASVMYQDYFVMMAKAAINEAIDLMKNYSYDYKNESLVKLAQDFGVEKEVILNANRSATLTANLPLNIRGLYVTIQDETIDQLTAHYQVPAARIIAQNIATVGIVKDGVKVTVRKTGATKKFGKNITLQQIVDYFTTEDSQAPIADLVSDTDITELHLIKASSELLVEPLSYVVKKGDTISGIAAGYSQPDYAGGVDIYTLCELNKNTAGIISTGFELTSPKLEKYITRGSDTILSLAQRLTNGDINIIINSTAFNDTFLQPDATLYIPPFKYLTGITSGDTNTIEGVLAKFGIEPELFIAANDEVESIWAEGTAITLINIVDIRFNELLAQLADKGRFNNLSGMAARFLLHGLRLPGDESMKQARLLSGTNWEMHVDTHALYDLTGQGLDLPALKADDEFAIILKKNPGASFINFSTKVNNGKKLLSVNSGNQLVATLKPADIGRIAQLTQATLDPKVPVLQAMQPYVETSRKFNFSNFTQWSYNAATPLWPAQASGVTPTIWQMPPSLLQAAFDPQKVRNPQIKLVVAKQDVPNAPVKTEDVANYSWTLSVPLSVRKVEVSSTENATKPNIYEIIGTDEISMMFLERLIRFCNTPDAPAGILDKVYVLYPPNPADNRSGSLLSNDPALVTSFIVKTNFSTESNPNFFRAETQPKKINSDPKQFAEMVWQASIVKTGGFYLYYAFDKVEELPANLFTNDNKADLKLVFTFGTGIEKGLVYDFMNSVAIGENINPANALLCAVSEEQVISGAKTLATDSIQSIANSYRVTIEELGDILADALIANPAKKEVTLIDLTYEIRPGDTLTSIANHFGGTTHANFEQLIREANPTVEDYTKVWTLINLPPIKIIPGSLPTEEKTMSQIAAYFYTSVTKVVHLFKDIEGLFQAGYSYTLTDHLTDRNAVIAPGTVGVELKRQKPRAKIAGDFEQYLENTFNMLGIKLAKNTDFEESGESLPAGFNDREKLKNKRLLRSVSADELWNYQRVLPVAPFAISNALAGSGLSAEFIAANPYAGIGGWVQLNMNWQDVFGNRTITPFSNPDRLVSKNGPLNLLPIKVAYTDQLTAMDKWPGFSANYAYHKEGDDTLLSLVFKFDISNYVVYYPVNPDAPVDPDKPADGTQGQKFAKDQDKLLKKIKADQQLYKNIIYQVWQPDVTLAVQDTLSQQKWVLTAHQLTQVRQMLYGIYNYLGALIAKEKPEPEVYQLYDYYKVMAGDVLDTPFKTATKIAADIQVNVNDLISINQGLEHPFLVSEVSEIIVPSSVPATLVLSGKCAAVNTQQIFELKVDITLVRDSRLVNDAFADTAGVGSVTTVLKPVGTTLEYAKGHFDEHMDTEGKQLSLGNFATTFEAAYANCKIASGTAASNLLSSDKEKQLWVVRWGGEQGIGFEIVNQPVYFTPAPLANHLVNFAGDMAIDIREFEPDAGFSKDAVKKNYAGISIDDWAKRFLDAIDNFLEPDYAIPAYVLDQNFPGDKSLKIIQEAKQNVATAITSFYGTDKIGSRLTNILEQPDYQPRDRNTASEKLRQSVLIKLGNAYKADTVVWFKTKVKSQYIQTDTFIPPNIYGQPLVPGVAQAEQLYSMSTSKIPLNNGDSDTAFIFSTQNKQDQKSIRLPLAYQVTHIEYDIKPVHILKESQNADYNASTWLSFVLPPVETIVAAENEKLNIPVPLKVYPAPPSIIAQEGNQSLKPDAKITLPDLLNWDYEYVYEQMGSAQDAINTKIEFNIDEKDSLLKALPDKFKLFANLAQFIETYPVFERFFDDKLVAITPLSSVEEMDEVRLAVRTFGWLATQIANSWKAWRQPDQQEYTSAASFESYEITEFNAKDLRPSKKGAEGNDMLVVRIEGASQTVPGIFITGFETVAAKDVDPMLGDGYVFKNGDGKYLLYADKGNYPKRTLKFAGLNILNKQNAWASISKIRNKDLVLGNKTNAPFIYRTPDVRFVNMMVPYLDTINYPDYAPINVAEIDGGAVQKPLVQSLQRLFTTVFPNPAHQHEERTIKMEVYYNYTLGTDPKSMVINLPVALLPPSIVDTATAFDLTKPDSFIYTLVNAMKNWFNTAHPVTTNANYLFDLSVYSNLKKGNLPMLRIRNLFLPVKDISDPNL
jgi:LysM repeat protein